MSTLGNNLRARAKEFDAELPVLLKNPKIDPALVGAVKAAVLPELMIALAEVVDVLSVQGRRQAMTNRLRELAIRNNKLRTAAARGDWNAISQLIDDSTGGIESAGEPTGEPAGSVAG